jgi:hypothetical protein
MDGTCRTHGKKRNACRFSSESKEIRDHCESLDVGGRIILNCLRHDGVVWTELIWLRKETGGGLF